MKSKINRKTNKKVNKLKTQKKRNLNHRGGCSGGIGNDVYDGSTNGGIKTGKFFSILEYYKLIKWNDCYQMYNFGKSIKNKKLLEKKKQDLQSSLGVIKGQIETTLSSKNCIIYDTSGQIKSNEFYSSPSFKFGTITIDIENGNVTLNQFRNDQINGENKLSYTFNFNDKMYIIIKKINDTDIELFIFSKEEAKTKAPIRFSNLKSPSERVNDIINSARGQRATMIKNRTGLTVVESREKNIQSNSSSPSPPSKPIQQIETKA
jgi:hypothetical protein